LKTKLADRRVNRTRQTLNDALIALILERGWEEVTVQHICERANIGRSTFYTHFADKEDLLARGFDDLHASVRALRGRLPGRYPLTFAGTLIAHTHGQRRLFRALVGNRSGYVVQQRFRTLLVDLVTEDLVGAATPGPRFDAAVRFMAGAFYELLFWWLDTGAAIGPDEVEALYGTLTASALEAFHLTMNGDPP